MAGKMTLTIITATAVAATWLVGTTAAADDTIDAIRASNGQEVAALWCSHCHSIDNAADGDVITEAPSFHEIANLDGQTSTRIKLFLVQPAHPMPNLTLTREEIRDLTAYIMSYREPPVGGGSD